MSEKYWLDKEGKDSGFVLVIADTEGFVVETDRPNITCEETLLPDGTFQIGKGHWNPISIRYTPGACDPNGRRFNETLDFIGEKTTFATLSYHDKSDYIEKWKMSEAKFGQPHRENGSFVVEMAYSCVAYAPDNMKE